MCGRRDLFRACRTIFDDSGDALQLCELSKAGESERRSAGMGSEISGEEENTAQLYAQGRAPLVQEGQSATERACSVAAATIGSTDTSVYAESEASASLTRPSSVREGAPNSQCLEQLPLLHSRGGTRNGMCTIASSSTGSPALAPGRNLHCSKASFAFTSS